MKQENVTIWIVVRVIRGFIEDAVVFRTRKAALARERGWRATLNRDYDESAVFRHTLRVRR